MIKLEHVPPDLARALPPPTTNGEMYLAAVLDVQHAILARLSAPPSPPPAPLVELREPAPPPAAVPSPPPPAAKAPKTSTKRPEA